MGEFVQSLKIKNGVVKKFVKSACQNLNKKKPAFISKICLNSVGYDGIGSAKEVCPVTCNICVPPTPTLTPAESPAPTETFECEESASEEFVEQLKVKKGVVKKFVKGTCGTLTSKKASLITKICNKSVSH